MKAPSPHPFLEAEHGPVRPDADALILGVRVDGNVSFRAGAAEGPSGIRAFSDSIESFSPRTGRDISDLDIVDLGDHEGDAASGHELINGILATAWTSEKRPLLITLGGDHSITPPVVTAVSSYSDNLAVIGFDAHMDLREDYPGDHACTYRRIADRGIPCTVLGLRSGARTEYADAPKVLNYFSSGLRIPADVRNGLEGRDIYLTIDIDVLDPSSAPGTGNPEPGGPDFNALMASLESLQGLNVVAFDVVEVSPPLDNGATQAAAAVIVRELLLRFTA